MELNIDELILREVLPWEFSLRVGGQSWATRPLVIADVARLQRLLREADSSVEAARGAVAEFFAEPRPDVSAWSMDQMLAAVKAVLVYWQKSAEKNSASISGGVEAEVVRMLMPGNSTAR
jgi:hypothetical protein